MKRPVTAFFLSMMTLIAVVAILRETNASLPAGAVAKNYVWVQAYRWQ